MTINVRLKHFQKVLKSEKTFEFYLHLNNILFSLIIDLEYLIKNLIKINVPKLYDNFNIDFSDINVKTNLSFFKSFIINLSILRENDKLNLIRQGITDSYKDNNYCKYAFYVIVIFGDFEGEDLVLSEIDIVIEVKYSYIILLRSALLEYFNLNVLKNRFSIIYYLKKIIL